MDEKKYFLCLGELPRHENELEELSKIAGGDAAIIVKDGYNLRTPIEKIIKLFKCSLYFGVIVATTLPELVRPFIGHPEIRPLCPVLTHALSAKSADFELYTPHGLVRYMNFWKFVTPVGIEGDGYHIKYDDVPYLM